MNYSFLFIISSSINHFSSEDFARNSNHERFLQTLETIESIKLKVPNSKICLFELSHEPIEDEYKNKIKDKVDLFLEFGQDPEIITLYSNFYNHPELFKYGKSLLEIQGMMKTLDYIWQNHLFTETTRIFKISGRYTLNKNFNISDYESIFLKGKYIGKYTNYHEHEPTTNVHYHVYRNSGNVYTSLWSFDSSLLYDTFKLLEKSFDYLQRMLLYTPGNDIEHSLYYFIDKNKLINCDSLGVTVRKGMDVEDYDL
jgi:hypothetical protein